MICLSAQELPISPLVVDEPYLSLMAENMAAAEDPQPRVRKS
jgi:hypothetical protein